MKKGADGETGTGTLFSTTDPPQPAFGHLLPHEEKDLGF